MNSFKLIRIGIVISYIIYILLIILLSFSIYINGVDIFSIFIIILCIAFTVFMCTNKKYSLVMAGHICIQLFFLLSLLMLLPPYENYKKPAGALLYSGLFAALILLIAGSICFQASKYVTK